MKATPNKTIQITINPYLEFVNSVLLTANYNEITMPMFGFGLMNEEPNAYTEAIRQLFKGKENSPAHNLIRKMIPDGFLFSRPVELALSLGSKLDFAREYDLSDLCVNYCGGEEKIKQLLHFLKELWEKIDYPTFFEKHKSYYDSFLQKAQEVVAQHDYVSSLESEYGKKCASYQIVISSLMNGNFGVAFEKENLDDSALFSVLSTQGFSISPAILFHEFSHPFINPLTEKYNACVKEYNEAYERLKPYKRPNFESGYGDWQECVNEHLVRAMVIHLLRKCGEDDAAEQMLAQDLYNGYRFLPSILSSYDYYDQKRELYPTFDSYYLELLKVFCETIL